MRTVADYYMEQGFAKGEARGEARGLAKGEALGMKKNAILVAQKMMRKGIKISDIMGITDLTLEQIKKIKSSPL